MGRRACCLLVAGLGAACAAEAAAAGRWETYIRPYGIADIKAGADSVWVGTTNAGLVLYDRRTGAFSSVARSPGGLPANEISALAVDRKRRLWVGTLGKGVGVMSNTGGWRVLNAFDGLPTDTVTSISAVGDTVWVGTTGGLLFWDGREVSGVLPDGTNPSPFGTSRITGVVETGDSVWVATPSGVFLGRISSGLQTWTDQASSTLPGTTISALVSDGSSVLVLAGALTYGWDGVAWVATSDIGTVLRLSQDHGVILASTDIGLYRWNATTWAQVPGAPASQTVGQGKFVLAAAVDPAGELFAGSFLGLYQQPVPPDPWTPRIFPGPCGNDLVNLAVDAASVYVTTRTDGYAGGIGRLRAGAWLNWMPLPPCESCTDRPYVPGADNFAIMIDHQGFKWVSAWSWAVEVLDDSGPTPYFTHLWTGTTTAEDRHTWGIAMAPDANGGRWIGGDAPGIDTNPPGGLDYYSADGLYRRTYLRANTPELISDQIRALVPDARGRMWVGGVKYSTGGGVNYFTIPTPPDTVLAFGESLALGTGDGMDVRGVALYGDSIWVLSADALRLFRSPLDTRPVVYPKLGPVSGVRPLEVTRDGSVWVTAEGGVRRFLPGAGTDGFIDYTSDNSPLVSENARSIRAEPGSGAVWIATDGGLNRFDPDYVSPPPPRLAQLHVRVFPNPIHLTGLGFALRLSGEGMSYRGAVYDLDGRRLKSIAVEGNGAVAWDGRDQHGELVPPGLYFVRVEAGGRTASARVAVLR